MRKVFPRKNENLVGRLFVAVIGLGACALLTRFLIKYNYISDEYLLRWPQWMAIIVGMIWAICFDHYFKNDSLKLAQRNDIFWLLLPISTFLIIYGSFYILTLLQKVL